MAGNHKFHVPPGEGKLVTWGSRGGYMFKLRSEDTLGAFCVYEGILEPGRLVAAHVHNKEDEFMRVLEGEVGARVGDQILSVPAGAYLIKPRGIPHAFWNASTEPVRYMELISPAHFEEFFDDMAGVFSTDPPRPEGHKELQRKYETESVDWDEEISRTYNVRVSWR